jgi:NADH-quinone oxidoreductase subunit L
MPFDAMAQAAQVVAKSADTTFLVDRFLFVALQGILVLPLAGFVVLALFGDGIRRDREEKGAAWLACGTVLGAFALALAAGIRLVSLSGGLGALLHSEIQTGDGYFPLHGALPRLEFDFMEVGTLRIPFAFLLDPLSLVMSLVVTGVGSLIHIYSVGYMAHDEGRVRFFSYLNLFTFFMLVLVLGANLPLLFVGWEGVGLCSYLLIGFWYKKDSASAAGLKAFIVNRIGDAGLILGMLVLFHSLGTLDLFEIVTTVDRRAPEPFGLFGPLTIAALLLFVGACGKSAQVPLHVWLPDAMEGPTPVSALIHAATMVTAGVYLVTRLAPLFAMSATASMVVAVVGTVTAILAAWVALVQTDIKKVLAYSTVSQLGFMFLAAGVGAYPFAIFHLVTHAFFKALLFLGSGSVIHAMSGEQDMRKMGGLAKKIPWTFGTFLIGTLAIAGIPPLAGFFSKDEILGAALGSHQNVLFGIGLFTAALTAFYMTRLLVLTFLGEFRGEHEVGHHVHESPATMLVPLVLLAVGSAVGGFLPVPELVTRVLRLEGIGRSLPWLPLLNEHAQGGHGILPIVATFVAILGIAAAFGAYVSLPDLPERVASRVRPFVRALENKWGFDIAYDWFVERVVVRGSDALLWRRVDAGVIDAAVNGTGRAVDILANSLRVIQTGLVRTAVFAILGGAVLILGYLLWS